MVRRPDNAEPKIAAIIYAPPRAMVDLKEDCLSARKQSTCDKLAAISHSH
jgi:hypothetical protein